MCSGCVSQLEVALGNRIKRNSIAGLRCIDIIHTVYNLKILNVLASLSSVQTLTNNNGSFCSTVRNVLLQVFQPQRGKLNTVFISLKNNGDL